MTLAQDLAGKVESEQVHALLLSRAPALLKPESDQHALYLQTVRGVTSEVLPVAGTDQTSARWALAAWAVTLGVSAQLEAALFPEQQGLRNDGRASYLDQRYQTVLAQLGSQLPGDAAGPATDESTYFAGSLGTSYVPDMRWARW